MKWRGQAQSAAHQAARSVHGTCVYRHMSGSVCRHVHRHVHRHERVSSSQCSWNRSWNPCSALRTNTAHAVKTAAVCAANDAPVSETACTKGQYFAGTPASSQVRFSGTTSSKRSSPRLPCLGPRLHGICVRVVRTSCMVTSRCWFQKALFSLAGVSPRTGTRIHSMGLLSS